VFAGGSRGNGSSATWFGLIGPEQEDTLWAAPRELAGGPGTATRRRGTRRAFPHSARPLGPTVRRRSATDATWRRAMAAGSRVPPAAVARRRGARGVVSAFESTAARHSAGRRRRAARRGTPCRCAVSARRTNHVHTRRPFGAAILGKRSDRRVAFRRSRAVALRDAYRVRSQERGSRLAGLGRISPYSPAARRRGHDGVCVC
jgi:hypothetical protein